MLSSPNDLGTVPRMQAALPRCIVTLSLCIRNWNDRGSSVTALMRWPRSWKKADASSPKAPRVSTAIGVNWYSGDSDWYLVDLRLSASLAAAPGRRTAWFRLLAARVSVQVKSQTMQRPLAQGITVSPSGRLPSLLDNELGSSIAGISADARARFIKSLTALWRMWRPADLRQASRESRCYRLAHHKRTCEVHTCLRPGAVIQQCAAKCCRAKCQVKDTEQLCIIICVLCCFNNYITYFCIFSWTQNTV